MDDLWSNPAGLIILFCLAALIIGLNLTLLGLLRGDRSVHEEAAKWGKALRGGSEASRRQDAQLDELHQAVSRLSSPTPPAPSDPSDE